MPVALQYPMYGTKPHVRATGAAPATACGAQTKSGGMCPNPAMANGRCRFHGGKTPPAGPAHPRYVHGERSGWLKNLPDELNEAAKRSIEQGAEIAQDDSIALIDSFLEDTTALLDRGGSWALWTSLRQHASGTTKLRLRAEAAERRASSPNASDKALERAKEARWDYEDALKTLFLMIEEGESDANLKRQAVDLLEQRRKHADTEIKRRTAAFASMQADKVLAMFVSLVDTATEYMRDRHEKEAFLRKVHETLPGLLDGNKSTDMDEPDALD